MQAEEFAKNKVVETITEEGIYRLNIEIQDNNYMLFQVLQNHENSLYSNVMLLPNIHRHLSLKIPLSLYITSLKFIPFFSKKLF